MGSLLVTRTHGNHRVVDLQMDKASPIRCKVEKRGRAQS